MSRKQKKYHFIYKTTCKITGKFYVGMHSSDSLDDGYLGSGKILGYSRHKYGDANHTREILEHCDSREQLRSREKEIVNEDMLSDPLNINLKYGGEGGWDKINESKLNVKNHRWKYDKTLVKNNAIKSNIRKKELMQNAEYRDKFSKNVSNGLKEYFKNNSASWLGKKHSLETRNKISASSKGKQEGNKNSQFGTIWITNYLENKKIKKDAIIPEGWIKGRKAK